MRSITKKISVVAMAIVLWTTILITASEYSSAATTTTNTTLAITAGTFSFIKDLGTTMDSYFGHSPSASAGIDIGTYGASLSTTNAASAGYHRFTVSDLLGSGFTVTIQSSDLTIAGATIPKAGIGYTGTAWFGTWQALTASPTSAVDIGTSPVTFVSRNNSNGLSQFSQEITIKVLIPGAQKPGSYTGLITFTY